MYIVCVQFPQIPHFETSIITTTQQSKRHFSNRHTHTHKHKTEESNICLSQINKENKNNHTDSFQLMTFTSESWAFGWINALPCFFLTSHTRMDLSTEHEAKTWDQTKHYKSAWTNWKELSNFSTSSSTGLHCRSSTDFLWPVKGTLSTFHPLFCGCQKKIFALQSPVRSLWERSMNEKFEQIQSEWVFVIFLISVLTFLCLVQDGSNPLQNLVKHRTLSETTEYRIFTVESHSKNNLQ